ncbi:FMRFamide-activated amiloride-sensitive sodium channel [Biomphalaria pfeifferi]|uniref:FMRFamide-activated amiloride-sensitive sodium channel n=1 Tax=Biomphalaria pfeifferi TaxID=112525 RepID=A0AAD8ATV7_BIOPF|nr:FMRFamide-activated amiloride-sensitive sodium channel [Biomphalaria pfeifferi]
MMDHLDKETRVNAGHQITDMLLYCYTTEGVCNKSDFKLFYSSALGNCYTLDTRSYIQQVEGSNEGLDIGIFLEPDEYIEELTETKGLQVLVHDTQSFVFPDDDGFQLLPGTSSNIALTLINTKNSPWPYGDCVDDRNDEYLRKYNYIYEFYFCNEICYNDYVLEKCKCVTTEYFDLLGSQGNADNQSLCSRDFTSYNCSTEALYDDYVCKCSKACSINTYNYRVTSLEWPTFKTGKGMVEYLCGRISMSRCKQLRKLSYRDLRENFVGMKIFFETFYVESHKVEPVMSITDFLCNLGGCIGLWIGVSILSLFEVLQLVSELMLAMCQRVK